MEERLARYRLRVGLAILAHRRQQVERRERYLRGDQDLPFAPEGVNEEYQDLREQAIANYFQIAVNAPVQRLRADGIRTQLGDGPNRQIWAGAWQANKLDTRQTIIYRSMMLHSRGIASVWPNPDPRRRDRPIVRPESFELVHVEMDPDDPFTPLWAIKSFTQREPFRRPNGQIVPEVTIARQVAILYDDETFLRFERITGGGGLTGTGDAGGIGAGGGITAVSDWEVVTGGSHPMRRPPFALYDYKVDALGVPWSQIDGLIPQQDAINTIRFNTLLAMQFSAYRQRIITGFDPRVVDKDGNVLYQLNPDGTPKVDANGNAIPMLQSPGRVGVDRLLAFPGGETKVFDLPESNLANYTEVLNSFLVQFFSTGQIPPQYLLNQMANLSGDALAGAESTLSSLVQELQLAAGEGHESMMELAWFAMGNQTEFDPGTETQWADAEARSFAQIIDAITKLISTGFPKRDAWQMIPGATQQKLDLWMTHAEDQAFADQMALAARPFVDVTPAGGSTGNTPPAAPGAVGAAGSAGEQGALPAAPGEQGPPAAAS